MKKFIKLFIVFSPILLVLAYVNRYSLLFFGVMLILQGYQILNGFEEMRDEVKKIKKI